VRGTWWVVTVALVACATPGAGSPDLQQQVETMLSRSAADWNRGDLAGFMSDYARDSLTSYVEGGHVRYGWQRLYDRYQARYFAPGKSRDSLTFAEVRARPLAADLALCTARFELRRGDSITASGPFTLILARRGGRWLILHDHTSADAK
jgi:ketosteroid isomerase-like protein